MIKLAWAVGLALTAELIVAQTPFPGGGGASGGGGTTNTCGSPDCTVPGTLFAGVDVKINGVSVKPGYQSTPPVAGVVTATAASTTSDTFDLGTLSANVTSFTINSITNPEKIVIKGKQAHAAVYTIASPTGFPGIPLSPFPDAVTTSTYEYAGGGTYVLTGVEVDSGPAYCVEIAAPGTPPSGQQTQWCDSTSHTYENKDSSGNIYYMVRAGTGITISSGGVISASSTVCSVLDPTCMIFVDETFCGGGNGSSVSGETGREGWQFGTLGAGTFQTPNGSALTDNNHPCGVHLLSPPAISDGMYLRLSPTVNQSGVIRVIPSSIFATGGTFIPFEMQWQAAISATTDIRFYIGLWATSTSLPTSNQNGCGFRYDTTLSDANWIAMCGNNTATATATVTGTVNTSIHRFRMWSTVQGTVNFSVDGGTTASISTDIPIAGAVVIPTNMISNDGTSTTSAMDLFRIVGQFTGLTVN